MPTSLSAMLALFNDNTAGDISAADGRAAIQALYDWIPVTEKYKMGRLAGETAHAADDFFTTYSGYTEVTPSGSATWALSRGGLSATHASLTDGHLAASLKAIPAAGVPITIETCFTVAYQASNYHGCGLCFTNGTSNGSTVAAMGFVTGGTVPRLAVPTGALNGNSTSSLGDHCNWGIGEIFIRLIWSAANTFEIAVSSDGGTWTDFGQATFTRTFTPTHMGLWVASGGSAVQAISNFRYLRVYEADLSV